jgi:hypothetical protein
MRRSYLRREILLNRLFPDANPDLPATFADPARPSPGGLRRFGGPGARVLERLERWSSGWNGLQAGLVCWALSTLVASPAFFGWSWEGITVHSRARDFLRLCQDPWARDLVEPIMAYRLTVPVFAWVLHLPPLVALAVPYVATIGFLAVSFTALRRRTRPVVAFLATVILSLSFALFWSNWHPGFTDTVTHLLAACLLLAAGPAWTFAGIFLGVLNDERLVLALPFILCWHYPPAWSGAWVRAAGAWLAAAALSLVCYAFLRHALSTGLLGPGIARPAVYAEIGAHAGAFRPHLGSWAVWALNVFLSFRWAWLVVALYLAALTGKGGQAGPVCFLGAALALGTLASLVVADVARSVGFMAPAWILATAGLESLRPARLPALLLGVVVALLLTPAFFTFEHFHVQWFRPLPLVIFRCLTGSDLVHPGLQP